MTQSYRAFLDSKSQLAAGSGFKPIWRPSFLFDFQAALVEWALQRGRAALYADCGLGKTPMQLVWAENIVRHTNGRVLILTPLAVSAQTVREGEKFGVKVQRSGDGAAAPGITVTNYERLERFDPSVFAGVVCDESSILKSFDGVRRAEITAFMRKVPYRLLCTATAAPNDYTELGTSSEALGCLGHMDMLHRFFRIDDQADWMGGAGRRHFSGGKTWRFKGHAEEPFWRWVCSWARAVRRPSDLGFDDGAFILPTLEQREHVVTARRLADGLLFAMPASGLYEQREERRRTITERCERAAALVNHDRPALVWCHLNSEGDLLERMIPDAVQVSGADSDEAKEDKLLAFVDGKVRALVIKPVIGAWGLNLQHCAHITFFPSHSFEQFYQGVRRCWRFGQTRPVVVDIVTTEGERGVMANLQRKAEAADRMFTRLVDLMNQQMHLNRKVRYTTEEEVPSWV